MKKLFLCASFACLGLFSSCQKDELVPEDSKPEWLGSSIYEELKSATHLTGTFDTYLRLVKDLGYDEVLSRTGSKTIFPANDDAFARFFASKDDVPRKAITMGMGAIMSAKKVLLIANGAKKKDIVMQSFFGPITPKIPASILQLHPDLTVIYSEN